MIEDYIKEFRICDAAANRFIARENRGKPEPPHDLVMYREMQRLKIIAEIELFDFQIQERWKEIFVEQIADGAWTKAEAWRMWKKLNMPESVTCSFIQKVKELDV